MKHWKYFCLIWFCSVTFKRVIRKKSTEEFSCIPYTIGLLNCLLFTWYGLPIVSNKWENFPLVTVNGVGIVLELAYVLIYFWYSSSKGKVSNTLIFEPLSSFQCTKFLYKNFIPYCSKWIIVMCMKIFSLFYISSKTKWNDWVGQYYFIPSNYKRWKLDQRNIWVKIIVNIFWISTSKLLFDVKLFYVFATTSVILAAMSRFFMSLRPQLCYVMHHLF